MPGRDLSAELFGPEPTQTAQPSGKDLSADLFGTTPSQGGFRTLPGSTFPTRQIDLGNGKTSEQRQDGGVWFGPAQGNTGRAGWFDASGNRLGGAPSTPEVGAPSESWMRTPLTSLIGPSAAIAQTLASRVFPKATNPTVGGAVHGVVSDVVAPAQLGVHALGSSAVDPLANRVEQYFGTQDKGGQMLGQALPFALTMGGSQAAQAPGMLARLGRIGQAGLTGGVFAPTFTMESGVQDNQDFWKRKGLESALGFGLGTVPAAAGDLGGIIKSGLAKIANTRAAQIMADAQATGVDIPASQILRASKPQPGEIVQAKAAVDKFAGDLAKQTADTPFAGIDEIRQAATSTGKRAKAAQDILQQIQQSGQDAEDLVQTSAGLQALRAKMHTDDLFALRDSLAGNLPPVTPTKAMNAIDEGIKQLSLDQSANNSAKIKALQEMKDRLANGLNFQQLSATRAGLGDMISDAYAGSSAVTGTPKASILQPIKNGIEADLERAAQSSNNPQLIAADKAARTAYSNYKGTFDDPTMIKAIQTNDPDKLAEGLAKAGADKAQRIYDALEPKGKAALAQFVFNDATKNAVNKRTGDWIPGNISGGIADRLKTLNVVMTGENATRLRGINNIMQTLAKVSPEQASALGQRIAEGAASASEKTNAIVKLYNMIKDGGVDMFFNNERGKNFLFTASKLKPGSDAMQAFINKDLPKLAPTVTPKVAPATVPLAAQVPQNPNEVNMESR